MDAMRLIEASRCALARSQEPAAIVAEVWQSQALAQAIGSRLAVAGPPELRGEALGLSELSGRGCAVLSPPQQPGPEEIRAAGLTEIGDAHDTLLGLGALLGEVGIALVTVAMGADGEGMYWQCMEAIDAADESRDRVLEMLRRLARSGGGANSGGGALDRGRGDWVTEGRSPSC
ncbi:MULTISPECIES: DUF6099 family protein [Streptomyces]|uniref:Uncharacterized protein n=1 Tax=Streptomyces lasiicapitis TaxID=1923961 RepID=A0ABQ2LKM1_9ACTN|nr:MULTISPECIES: DUF6099 family protein [Streptomyces]QIB43035.1 hypothetical protein G3H79_08100 [Streptomyces aureoverticillatus]GGO38625.1 hypothetical protein GCM10012286_13960 [Streptomyces lasiicapitis]